MTIEKIDRKAVSQRRERLIELLDQNFGYVQEQKAETLADYLLENDVIVKTDDVVEVVRCKDCVHHTPCEGGLSFCCFHRRAVGEQDFCRDGEREEKEE